LLQVAQQFGLEGLVAKRKSSDYESGRRSDAWVKFKITKSQKFAIGSYTLSEGSRSSFIGGVLEMCNARLYGFWGNLTT